MRKSQLGMLFQQLIDVIQRLGRSLEALQAQGKGVTRSDVLRRQRDGALEELQRVSELAFLLQARGHHVEQQRVLETTGECFTGDGARSLEIAVLGQPQDFPEHGLVCLQVTRHRSIRFGCA